MAASAETPGAIATGARQPADGPSWGNRMRREFALSSAGLAAAFDFISETLRRNGRNQAVARRFSIVVDEICANLIKHDGSLTEADRFVLELTDDGDGTDLMICDPGRPFNPLEHRRDDLPEIGGYGLELVRRLCSRARYERTGGCNRLTVSVDADLPAEQ